jgi:drug/metabolite transporter (DMT)-like permease
MSSSVGAALSGIAGMTFVGGSVAVSGALADAPLYTAQGVRYGIACALLIGYIRLTGRRLAMPRGVEWWWLLGVTVSGLLVFNIALVEGSQHAEPAVLGVAVACVPIVLAVMGPLLEGHLPRVGVLAAAVVVTAGAVLVQGIGRCDALGFIWAIVVFVSEAGFTLLAVPVLGRHGAEGVSVHATAMAAVMFGVLGVSTEGWGAATEFDGGDLLAIGYLAVGVTAVAFVLWYSCVCHLGAARAGLLTGIAPVAAAAIGIPITGDVPALPVWAGVGVIAAGLAVGISQRSRDGKVKAPQQISSTALPASPVNSSS